MHGGANSWGRLLSRLLTHFSGFTRPPDEVGASATLAVPSLTSRAAAIDLAPRTSDTSAALYMLRFVPAFAVLFGHAISYFRVADALRAPTAPYMPRTSACRSYSCCRAS